MELAPILYMRTAAYAEPYTDYEETGTDIISFLGLAGLFTAHITGNLVVLAAHAVTRGEAHIAAMLSVPVFIAVLGLTRLVPAAMKWFGVATLRPLLLIQFLPLAGFLLTGVAGGLGLHPNATPAICAGMLGVAAIAVQNALVQISIKCAPATAVMTTNITRFMMDIGEISFGRDNESAGKVSTTCIYFGLSRKQRLVAPFTSELRAWGRGQGRAGKLIE